MFVNCRWVLAIFTVLQFVLPPAAHAQRSLAQLREDLIAPWLMTVKGDDRDRLLRINEISQDTEGSFIVVGNLGWVVGSLWLLLGSPIVPNGLGTAFIIGQATAVAVLAEMEFLGVRRVPAPA